MTLTDIKKHSHHDKTQGMMSTTINALYQQYPGMDHTVNQILERIPLIWGIPPKVTLSIEPEWETGNAQCLITIIGTDPEQDSHNHFALLSWLSSYDPHSVATFPLVITVEYEEHKE